MAKKLNDISKQHLHLNNHYTTHNPTSIAHNLTKLTISDNHPLITLDIKNLYFNIPISKTISITRNQLLKHNDWQTIHQICTLLEIILGQNFFTFQDRIYKPDEGVGSPVSGIKTEIFLHLEDSHIKFLLDSKHIPFYSRYMDNIIIIYDTTRTNPETIFFFLPVANAPDVLQPCGLLYYPWCSNSHHQSSSRDPGSQRWS